MKSTLLVENKDTKLFTTVYPRPGAETIIFLHGGPGLPDGLTFVAEYVARWFQVICFHQRGTLRSPAAESFSMESYMSDIDSIALHLALINFICWVIPGEACMPRYMRKTTRTGC